MQTGDGTGLPGNVGGDVGQRELIGFRRRFYDCLNGWGDALFELCDAVLCSPTPVGSVPSLSLEPVLRRSHGSLYKALAGGMIDTDRFRRLLVESRPQHWPAVFAVDASTWDRCDAETSPERGFYYSASKHSNGQPIVAGWSYQWITQLGWAPDSWTAPMDARRITPHEDAVTVTIDQIDQLTGLAAVDRDMTPMFVFDAGYDPVALTVGLADTRAQILVRISPKRVFHPNPTPRPPERYWATPSPRPTFRPVRSNHVDHPRPDADRQRPTLRNRRCPIMGRDAPQTSRAGTMGRPRPATNRARHHHPSRGRAPPQTHHQHDENAVVVVVRARPTRPRRLLARLPTPVRHRAHLPVPQKHTRLDHPISVHPRTSRPLDLAHRRRLHPTSPRPRRHR